MAGLTLRAVRKSFGDTEVVRGVDLDVGDGEFVVFVGPSGCGKSTLLRMIAGLETTTSGTIAIGGRDVTREDPARRGVAMVFQTYALYPHMTVAENMGFPLEMAKRPREEIDRDVREAARILHLDDFLKRRPRELSGGQRQRVAIGRAIVRQPQVFLFDEPLSNLDAELRVQMRLEIARLHQTLGTTMVYVTHDQVEAMTLASRIVVLRGGRIEQVGAPLELYESPDNRFVAGFLGSPRMNFFAGRVEATAGTRVTVAAPALAGPLQVTARGATPFVGEAVHVGIRPEHFAEASAAGGAGHPAALAATVTLVERLGGLTYVHAAGADGTAMTVETRDPYAYAQGAEARFAFPPGRALLFAADGTRL